MSPQRRTGFTVVELLVSVGVIFVLLAAFLPVISSVRVSSLRTIELANLRQLTTACIIYSQNNDGAYPVGRMRLQVLLSQLRFQVPRTPRRLPARNPSPMTIPG